MAADVQTSSDDETFLAALYKGSELLSKGDLQGAKVALAEALALRPSDAKGRNLLGLSHFKLGEYEPALEIYRTLVHENPVDATLRVNLGLVHLKTGAFEDAIRELSVAADFDPEHKRAQNYLGLAYARVGDYAQARECFAAAGSDQMVEQMEKALAGEPFEGAGLKSSATPAGDAFGAEIDTGETHGEEVVVEVGEDEDVPPVGEPPPPAPVTAPAPLVAPAPPPAPAWRVAVPLVEASEAAAVAPPEDAAFAVGHRVVVAQVRGELLCKVRGLVAAEGDLAFQPEVKRFRGRTTDKPFGEGADRIQRVRGTGRVLIASGERVFNVLRLDGVDGYFREEMVFGFEETVSYENGRVPSNVSPDLNLVHLRGQGAVLVDAAGELITTEIVKGHPLRVPLTRLVGWHGAVTPRISSFSDDGGEGGGPLVAAELSGEGVAIMSLPPRR